MKVEKIWYFGFYSFIVIALSVIVLSIVTSFNTDAIPIPDWAVTKSEATGLCYEVHKGIVFQNPVSCP